MKTREDVIRASLALGDVYEDYPFHDENWTAMRHRKNQKTFAFIFARMGKIWIMSKPTPPPHPFGERFFRLWCRRII